MREASPTASAISATAATLSPEAAPVESLLQLALNSLQPVIPFDLAVVLDLEGDLLAVRTAVGKLATEPVQQHRVDLERFPAIRRALETRRPVVLLEADHTTGEGDPYRGVVDLPHGHSCMVVPLHAAGRSLGAMTFDRAICEPYSEGITELAGVYGQLIAMGILYAEQAARLRRHREALLEQNGLLLEETALPGTPTRLIERCPSSMMQRVLRQAQQVAVVDAPVLVLGETGVGKEVLARAIHGLSARAREPFVAVNCAAIPAHLIESELFGHVRGAFTGAQSRRPGRFLTADGGTLLLDEVGDMPLPAQAKLLRVLQEGTLEPVGSDRTARVDVRVIATTNVDLELAVREGRFREDLYYRLDVFPIVIPPLRERPEDMLPLAENLLEDIARHTGRGPWTLSTTSLRALQDYDWPGNVRQLRNAVERATILQPSGELDLALRESGDRSSNRPKLGVATDDEDLLPLRAVERRHIERVLRHTSGRIYGKGGAADLLALKPTTLQSRLQKLGIDRRQFTGE